MQQLCRELLLLESSDWQFLITTGAARDYAEIRFLTHNDQFNEIKTIWQSFESAGVLTQPQEARLAEIERRDGVFPDIDPGLWVAGAKQERIEAPVATSA
jgi:1,4-alpha-glucan branching enzyme